MTITASWSPVSMVEPPVGAPIDANGNLTADGTRTFEWDARNQLVAVNVGTHRSEFTYNGQMQRVRAIEKENGTTQGDTTFVWCDDFRCEAREGGTTVRRMFGRGEQVAGNTQFMTHDHLESAREITNAAGALLARYDFDPWGARTAVAGDDVTSVGYTGHENHAASGLALSKYRAFDASLGRWLSEDPIGFGGGPNFYGYVLNSPLALIDPLGLQCQEVARIPLGTTYKTLSDRPVGLPEIINIQVVLGPARVPFVRGGFRPQYLVTCFFQQETIRETVVSKHYLGLFRCEGDCGQTSYEYEFYTSRHFETTRYWRRWGRQFTMDIFTPLPAVAGECRKRA
jgi:RHS repeat-associated protein